MPSPRQHVDELRALYAALQPDADVDLAAFLRDRPVPRRVLPDLIDADGRCRLAARLTVDLRRYLDAIPGLPEDGDALDAAIDMALRALSGSGRPTPEAIRTLASQYPRLEREIRDAASLNLALGALSTSALRGSGPGGPPVPVPTPCNFGPRDARGEQRYLLRRFLGAGASGIVYEAVDRTLSEPDHEALIAIKVLRAHADHPRVRDAFFEEATKVRRISHPGVVQVHDCGIADNGDPYLVYEFLPRGDLQLFLSSQPGPVQARRAAELVARIARGVHAAHSAGLIHCDLKPSNVLLDDDGHPKVSDFGVAIRLGQLPIEAAGPGDIAGTTTRAGGNLAFMSPEQYRNEAASVSTAADIYALGGLLFYLLTQTPPNGATVEEVERAHDPATDRRAVSLRALRPDVPSALEAVCRRALAPARDERHESAAALADDLERWLQHRPIAWTRPSFLTMLSLWVRRRPALAALLFALIVVASSGAATAGYFSYANALQTIENAQLETGLALESLTASESRAALAEQRADASDARASEAEAKSRESQAVSLAERSTQGVRSVQDTSRALSRAMTLDDVKLEIPSSILPETFMTDWLFGPDMLDDPVVLAEKWSRRIEIAGDIVGDAYSRASPGDPPQLRTLLWESTLGIWLTLDGDPALAVSVVSRNRENWKALLPHDPWIKTLDGIHASAEAKLLLRDHPEKKDELNTCAVQIRRCAKDLFAASGRTTVHLLLLGTLRQLYGQRGIDDPAQLNLVLEELKGYGTLGRPRPSELLSLNADPATPQPSSGPGSPPAAPPAGSAAPSASAPQPPSSSRR